MVHILPYIVVQTTKLWGFEKYFLFQGISSYDTFSCDYYLFRSLTLLVFCSLQTHPSIRKQRYALSCIQSLMFMFFGGCDALADISYRHNFQSDVCTKFGIYCIGDLVSVAEQVVISIKVRARDFP